MPTIQVSTASARYAVHVQRGAVRQVVERTREAGVQPTAVAIISDETIGPTWGAAVERMWMDAGVRTCRLTMQPGEDAKTLATVQELCLGMLDAGLDRRSVVVAVGGGVVGDTAGLAAALFMRGIACVQVPTTLLAMVDAALGGKTAVNLLRADGTLAKNMVGAFWQPKTVLCDPELLRTLDARELRCGLAECIKHGVLRDGELLEWMVVNRDALIAGDARALEQLVARSAVVKAGIVSHDEREDGDRALLNLGHTFAHAIEAVDHAHVRHGEAVAIGLVAAAHLAQEIGPPHTAVLRPVSRVIEALGLPARLPNACSVSDLMHAMRGDKKTVAGGLRLVVPFAVGDVHVIEGVPDRTIANAWRSVGAT